LTGKNFRRLVLAHRRELHAYLTEKLRDCETAADLTQETFLRFAEQGRSTAILHDRAYLYRTVHNLPEPSSVNRSVPLSICMPTFDYGIAQPTTSRTKLGRC
jgi:hypothetical protein